MRAGALARPLALFLSGCVLLSALGCASSSERAGESRSAVKLGMTMGEVSALIGTPEQVIRNEARGDTLWVYRYEGGIGTFLTIVMVVLVVTIIVLVVILLSEDNAPDLSGAGDPSDGKGSHARQFRVQFGPEGRVIGISPVYAGE